MKLKAEGKRGSWFAIVEGQTLPCVHQYWWKGGRYNDPHARPDMPKFTELVKAIRATGRVVLTKDEALDDGGTFKRTGYIAVYKVDEIEFDEQGLRFRFIERLDDLTG